MSVMTSSVVSDLPVQRVLAGRDPWLLQRGDSLEILRDYPSDSFDSAVIDPPYGLSKEPKINRLLLRWLLNRRYSATSGFAGETWDVLPGPDYWREVLRVLKPGAFAMVFAAARTFDIMSVALRIAGFERPDSIRLLTWQHSQGMPKSKGRLKDSWEAILVCRKPLSEVSIKANLVRWGTGQLFPERCRIPRGHTPGWHKSGAKGSTGFQGSDTFKIRDMSPDEIQKRCGGKGGWPSNVVLVHDDQCVQVGTRKVKGHRGYPNGPGGKSMHYTSNERGEDVRPEAWEGYADEHGMEDIAEWACVPGCPVREMDRQSGVRVSGRGGVRRKVSDGLMLRGLGASGKTEMSYNDSGGASRFHYQAKASRSERWFFCLTCGRPFCCKEQGDHTHGFVDGKGRPTKENHKEHKTVKPLNLCSFLCRLATPLEGVIVDPFGGTMSTGVAALREGYHFVGMDLDPEYIQIGRYRLQDVAPMVRVRRGRQAR